MTQADIYLKNLTGRDEKLAEESASYLVNNADIELFKKLVDKSDYLFDFVRNNVYKRIEKAVTSKKFYEFNKVF